MGDGRWAVGEIREHLPLAGRRSLMNLDRMTLVIRRSLIGLLTLSAILAPVLASAQRSIIEQTIQDSFTALQMSDQLFMRLAGTEVNGDRVSQITYDTYFKSTAQPIAGSGGTRTLLLVNIVGYRDSVPFIRLVGDGTYLWRYDTLRNRYSSIAYGSLSGAQPEDYIGKLFRYLTSFQDGYSSYPITLLRQTYGSGIANYQSWMPGITPTTDKLGNVVYLLQENQSPRRQIRFDTAGGSLGAIDFWESMNLHGLIRTTQWSMSLVPGLEIASTNFVFTVPAGAQAYTLPKLSQ